MDRTNLIGLIGQATVEVKTSTLVCLSDKSKISSLVQPSSLFSSDSSLLNSMTPEVVNNNCRLRYSHQNQNKVSQFYNSVNILKHTEQLRTCHCKYLISRNVS